MGQRKHCDLEESEGHLAGLVFRCTTFVRDSLSSPLRECLGLNRFDFRQKRNERL